MNSICLALRGILFRRALFQAAFLQWYFQELAGFEVLKCGKYGCENAVPPGRKIL